MSVFYKADNLVPDDRNRRRHPRRPTRIRVWADPGGVAPVVDCVILDLSEGGACVTSLTGVELPDVFELQADMRRSLGRAEVAWRNDRAVGVRLVKPPAAGKPE